MRRLTQADSLVRRAACRRAARGVFVVIGTTVDNLAAWARGLAGGALDLGTGGRLGTTDARAAGAGRAGTTGGRLRRKGRIADGFALARRTIALRARGAVAGFARRAGDETFARRTIAAQIVVRRTLAIGDRGTFGPIGGGGRTVVASRRAFAMGRVGARRGAGRRTRRRFGRAFDGRKHVRLASSPAAAWRSRPTRSTFNRERLLDRLRGLDGGPGDRRLDRAFDHHRAGFHHWRRLDDRGPFRDGSVRRSGDRRLYGLFDDRRCGGGLGGGGRAAAGVFLGLAGGGFAGALGVAALLLGARGFEHALARLQLFGRQVQIASRSAAGASLGDLGIVARLGRVERGALFRRRTGRRGSPPGRARRSACAWSPPPRSSNGHG